MLRLLMIGMLLFLVGCRSWSIAAKPVVIPVVGEIKTIEVTPNSGEAREVVVIDDPEQIERFGEFINARKAGWKTPAWTTFPSGRYTVVAKDEAEETVAVFWPSPGHIGGRDGDEGADSNRLRSLTAEEWKELSSILGISKSEVRDEERR